MPICTVYTNLKDADLPNGMETRLAEKVAHVLGKPLERMAVVVIPNTRIFRLGTLAPACIMLIRAIGVFNAEKNPTYTPPIIEHLNSELKIDKKRIEIVYESVELPQIGLWNP